MEENKKNLTGNLNEDESAPSVPPANKNIKKKETPMAPATPFMPKGDKKISEDIKKILQGTKLPEKRDLRSQGDTKQTEAPEKKVFVNEEFSIKTPQSSESDAEKTSVGAKPVIPSMRTFKDDLQTLVKVKKMSLVKAATLENDKRRGQEKVANSGGPVREKSRARVFAITFAIVVLVGLGGLAALAVITIQGQRASDVQVADDNSFLFTEQTFTLPLTGQKPRDLLNQLAGARQGVGLTLGAITRIVPTVNETNIETGKESERQASTSELLNSLGTRAPQDLVKSFDDVFFMGVHTVDENVPIIIIPILLYQNAFAGMLEWEDNINEDLSPLFSKVPYQTKGADGNISPNRFEDIIIRNFDVRALRDLDGSIRMLYAFPTREILIIAESPLSFVESLARLRAERRL
jgi:hypothetical protein